MKQKTQRDAAYCFAPQLMARDDLIQLRFSRLDPFTTATHNQRTGPIHIPLDKSNKGRSELRLPQITRIMSGEQTPLDITCLYFQTH